MLSSALMAFAVGMFLCLVVPLQTFLGNRDMFSFSAADVMGEALPVSLLVVLAVFMLLVLSARFAGRVVHVVVAAVLVCCYLETGLFSIGLPSLDGGVEGFWNPYRRIIDSALLALAFLLVVALFRWTRCTAHWIALAVLALGVASLFDVSKAEVGKLESPLSGGFCPQLDVVKSARFSRDRNVIVLILDSTPAVLVTKILRDDPCLQKRFPGFVSYDRNLAMSEYTVRGLPGLMTGKYLQPGVSTSEYMMSVFGPDSFVASYVDAGMPVFFSDEMLKYGYTNRRLGDFSKIGEELRRGGPVFFRNSTDYPYVTLFDASIFRLTPYFRKANVLQMAYEAVARESEDSSIYHEASLYPMLAAAPLSDERGTALSVFHTVGMHSPITKDRRGNPLSAPDEGIQAHCEYGIYVLEQLAKFFDSLMASGVYDNSFIVVCADHGIIALREGDGRKRHGSESSVLWVKRPNDRSPMSFSSLPTSNARLCALVKAMRDKDLDRAQIDGMLEMHNRKFIAKFGATFYSFGRYLYFYEWTYDDNNNVISCENLGIFKAN